MKVQTQFRSEVKEVCHFSGQIRVLKVAAEAWWLGQAGKIEEGEFWGKKGAEEPIVPQPP